jgi:hypothetical protein
MLTGFVIVAKMHNLSFLFACLVQFLVFQAVTVLSESYGTTYNVLGANLVTDIDPRTGFITGRDSRLNTYGESSSLTFRFKPHDHKLQLMLQEVHSCFDVRYDGGQVIMKSKPTLRGNQGCSSAGVKAFASSSLTTRRILRYDLQHQPSLNDLSAGDFLYLDPRFAVGQSQARVITSIDSLSVPVKGSKSTAFVINTREADYIDAFSEGTYEFRTENILTVNDAPKKMKPRWGLPNPLRWVNDNLVKPVVSAVKKLVSNEYEGETTLPLVNFVSAFPS